MHSATILLGSLLATLALAAPLPTTISITLKTGDGDSSTVLSAPLNQPLLTASNPQARQGVAASISDGPGVCQAFSDAAATTPLGAPFTSIVAGSFTAASSGSVASIVSQAMPIGAFVCALTNEKLAADIAALKKATGTSSTTTTAPPASSTTTAATPPPPAVTPAATTTTTTVGAPVARVQMQIAPDTFVQNDVPADGSLFLTAGSSFGNSAIDASLVEVAGGNIKKTFCQVFSDAGANNVAGSFDVTSDATLSADFKGVPIGAINCVIGL